MQKLLKNNFKILIIILITTIVASVTTIFAYSLIAENVGYTPKDTTWNVENVGAAVDDLYIRANSTLITSMNSTELLRTNGYIAGGTKYTISNTNEYKYFFAIDTYTGGSCTSNATCNNIGNLTFTNAYYIDLGFASRVSIKVTGKAYLLYPIDRSQNIVVTIASGSDGIALYGIK